MALAGRIEGVSGCIYCGLEAWNVMEVRYARTIQHASSGVAADDAPREVVGRGYYLCDGCLALLDFHVQHHLPPDRHALFNLSSAVYHFLAVWGAVAFGSVAGSAVLLRDSAFLSVGLGLAVVSLAVWFGRATVHSRYYGQWQAVRQNPVRPGNSLGAFTSLRDRIHPELVGYLPVSYKESLALARLPGSPPVRCLGPNGEPWGEGPDTNFVGRGDHEWYRLVWISWRLWPLTRIAPPDSPDWQAPPAPSIEEIEVAVATALAAGAFATLSLGTSVHLGLAFLVAFVAWPVGFLAGRHGRRFLRAKQAERVAAQKG